MVNLHNLIDSKLDKSQNLTSQVIVYLLKEAINPFEGDRIQVIIGELLELFKTKPYDKFIELSKHKDKQRYDVSRIIINEYRRRILRIIILFA